MKDRLALVRNAALVAAAAYIEAAVGLLAGVVVARALGPADFGRYAFAVWLCGALMIACNNALTTSSIKFMAEARGQGNPQLADVLGHRLLRFQTFSSSLVVCLFCLYAVWRPLPEWKAQQWQFMALIALAVWSRAGFWMRGALSKGYESFLPENLALMITSALNLVLVLSLALMGGTLLQFVATYALLGLVCNLVVRLLGRRSGMRLVHGDLPPELRQRLKKHLLLTGVMMLLVMMTNRAVEMTMLKSYANVVVLGYFAIASTLTKGAIDLLVGGMSSVLLPSMARRFGAGGNAALASMMAESSRLYWFLGLAIAGLGLTVADGLVHVLYGSRYDGAMDAVQWQLVVGGLCVVSGAAAAVLSASDRQLDRVLVVTSALALNLLLGWLLIPRYWLTGALISFGVTHLAACISLMWVAIYRTGARLPWVTMGRLTLAALVATILGWSVSEVVHLKLSFLVGGAAFVAVYLPLSVVMRTWRAADFDVFDAVLRRLGAPGRALGARLLGLKSRFALADMAA